MLLSLNFSILIREHARYNTQVLMNRIRLWLVANRCSSVKTVKILPALFKILKEEFFKDEVYKLRDQYHEKELKKSIRKIAFAQEQTRPEGA